MIKRKDIKNTVQLYAYISALTIAAVLLMVYLVNEYTISDYTLLIVFSILSAIAETFLILLPKVGGVSVSFALTFSAILLTNPLTAAIITASGIIFRCPYIDGKGRVHIFNNPIYKTVFNISQYIINAGVAGLIYEYINNLYNFGFKVFNPIAGSVCLIIYLLLNSFFMAVLMSILLKEKLSFIWKNYLLGFFNIALVSLLGIVIAF
jgi:hypothetical protein